MINANDENTVYVFFVYQDRILGEAGQMVDRNVVKEENGNAWWTDEVT